MEILTSFLNPTQMGHLREVSKGVSLDDVAEVATSSFRSIGTQREDSLVFVLGLLNLGTVLCYAVYSQLFKPVRRGLPQMDDNTFVFKKIQTILDELVLHVHTTTYYRSSIEKSQELTGKNLRDSTFRGRSGSAATSTFQSVFSFFDLPEPAIYGEKEPPPLPLTSSSRTAEEFEGYLQEEAKKLVHEWLSFLIQSTVMPTTGRLTKRHTRMQFPHTYRRNNNATSRRPSVPPIKKRIAAPLTQTAITREPQQQQQQQPWNNRERTSQRRPQIKRPVSADAEADGRADEPSAISSPRTGPDVPHPARQDDPVLPVHALFPQETVREAGSNSKSGRSSSRSAGLRSRSETEIRKEKNEETKTAAAPEPRHIPSEFHHQQQQMYRNPAPESSFIDMEESATVSKPVEEDGLIVRLMHLIQQTAPLAMDVLGVYKSKNDGQHNPSSEPKCLERLLCQLNQDWKTKGSVPAAMAPFLRYESFSIS